MELLHARPFRSVHLDARDGAAVIVKRFHHPDPLLALFDARRARREFEALVALERAGFPVPHPLGFRADEQGWELRLAAVPGARTLDECLRAGASGADWERLLPRLGELLARLQSAGWEHGDLHAGNVLVDGAGSPWLIDLQHARRAPIDAVRRLDELVECAAAAREHLRSRLRARFLVAWSAALPRELRPELAGGALALALEERARRRRLARVSIGLGRWLRESSRVRRVEHEGTQVWLRRDLALASLEHARDAGWLVLRGGREELRSRWLGAARLAEHVVPASRPAAFAPLARPVAWAAFETPKEGAGSAAELHAALADRLLDLVHPELTRSAGGLHLLPPHEPQDFRDS